MKSKKGFGLKDITPIAILVLVSVIALSIGSSIVTDVHEDQCASGGTYNTTLDRCVNSSGQWEGGIYETAAGNISLAGHGGVAEFGSWIPTIVLVIAAAIIIGILMVSFKYGG